jgi:vitamin B12/bleomycin/antimicrobial peptide transport system ATP-binding/permease protein
VHLTERITAAFFASDAYYRVVHMGQVDNPDQRIAQDVSTFVESSARVINVVVSKIFNVIAFSGARATSTIVADLSVQ